MIAGFYGFSFIKIETKTRYENKGTDHQVTMIMSVMHMIQINGKENVRRTVWRTTDYADIFRIDLS